MEEETEFANNVANKTQGLSEELLTELTKKNIKLKEKNSKFRIVLERIYDDYDTILRQKIMNSVISVDTYNLHKDKDFRELPKSLYTDEEGNIIRSITKFKRDFTYWYDFPIDIKIEIQTEDEYLKRKRFRDSDSEFVKYRNTEQFKKRALSLIECIENEEVI